MLSFECCSSTMVSTLNSEFLRLPGGCLQSRDRKESRDKIEGFPENWFQDAAISGRNRRARTGLKQPNFNSLLDRLLLERLR